MPAAGFERFDHCIGGIGVFALFVEAVQSIDGAASSGASARWWRPIMMTNK
jgi:hypothetical protein